MVWYAVKDDEFKHIYGRIVVTYWIKKDETAEWLTVKHSYKLAVVCKWFIFSKETIFSLKFFIIALYVLKYVSTYWGYRQFIGKSLFYIS